METKMLKIILLLIIFGLTSCGSSSSGESSSVGKASSSEQSKVNSGKSTLFDAQVDSIEKAENVEGTVLKASQTRKQQMQDL
ncbi:MAG: maltose-binding protein MalE [Dinoroseobacter sp.]|jgi:maltose-binding protein MalE